MRQIVCSNKHCPGVLQRTDVTRTGRFPQVTVLVATNRNSDELMTWAVSVALELGETTALVPSNSSISPTLAARLTFLFHLQLQGRIRNQRSNKKNDAAVPFVIFLKLPWEEAQTQDLSTATAPARCACPRYLRVALPSVQLCASWANRIARCFCRIPVALMTLVSSFTANFCRTSILWTPGPAPLECRPCLFATVPAVAFRVFVGFCGCAQTESLLAVVITLLRVKQDDHLFEH